MATLGMFVLKPFGSYQYTNLKHGNFNTATLAQYAGKRSYNSCLMTLGSRVVLNLAGLDAFTLEGRMAWITQLRKRTESIQSFCYGRVPGTVSMSQPYFHGTGAGSDLFWGGIGLRLSLKGTLSVSADYGITDAAFFIGNINTDSSLSYYVLFNLFIITQSGFSAVNCIFWL